MCAHTSQCSGNPPPEWLTMKKIKEGYDDNTSKFVKDGLLIRDKFGMLRLKSNPKRIFVSDCCVGKHRHAMMCAAHQIGLRHR